MIQLVSRGCASCALFRTDGRVEHGRCATNGKSVERLLVVPEDCPARRGVLVTTNEEHVTISNLIVMPS